MTLGPKHRKKFSSINAGIVAEIVEQYLSNPDAVDQEEFDLLINSLDISKTSDIKDLGLDSTIETKNYCRNFGYLHAEINPLETNTKVLPANINPTEIDRSLYLDKIGYEFIHLRNSKEKNWLYNEIENSVIKISQKRKLNLVERLVEVEGFEKFLHKGFLGARWYSLEGSESMIIVLDEIIRLSTDYDYINVGMPHRGRLNVLAHVFDKPYSEIFSEFREENINHMSSGRMEDYLIDVKYHLGAKKSQDAEILLFPNPSHLEMINPVILGVTKAQQMKNKSSLGILIHGDAAFPGEGINSETFNLSKLEGYDSKGAIHIVTNNQIGFTTNPENSFSTLFATDFVRGYDIPIIHVNGDDIESCVIASTLATKYKNKFNKDIVLDIVSYRRFGHQEMDDPSISQPLMYKKIKNHPTITKIFGEQLVSDKIITQQAILEAKKSHSIKIDSAYNEEVLMDSSIWPGEFKTEQIDYESPSEKISEDQIQDLNKQLYEIESDFSINKRINQVIIKRKSIDSDTPIEWGHAEMLTWASLLVRNISIRFSGQDSQRGTFNQRNAILWDDSNGSALNLLNKFVQKENYVEVINSPLSEVATLAFEFGFSIIENKAMTIWEAQFGDFINNAQAVMDEFIISSQPKWGLDSNLIVLLPHGYEGMGPNHSSGWIERFLESADNNNIAIANCSTSGQYFHLIRAQCLINKQSNPLIIFTPKSLLRHPLASSTVQEIANSNFNPILEKNNVSKPKKLVFGSGKIIIDILSELQINSRDDIALVSIEMLYPFPENKVKEIIEKYSSVKEIIWVQEEPKNRGAWNFINERISLSIDKNIDLKYVGRKNSAATASGSASLHKIQQQEIIDQILN
ncbi:MAG: 2-oxoglutarate dehydrogenase E1 component [Chloroflexota bacterium]